MDLITDIPYCEAMARAGLLGSVVQAWEIVGDRCDMAAAYVDSLRGYINSNERPKDPDAVFRVVADILKQSNQWREIVIGRAVERARFILTSHGLDFEPLAMGHGVADFFQQHVQPRIRKGDTEPLVIAALWMQAHRHRDGLDNWRELANTCCRLMCELGDDEFYDRGHTQEALTCFELAAGLDPDREAALWGVLTVCLQGSPMTPEEAVPYQALLLRVASKRDEMTYILDLAVKYPEGHGTSPEPGWSVAVDGLDRFLVDPLGPGDSDACSVLEAKSDALARVVETAEERYQKDPTPENEQRLLGAQWRAREVPKKVPLAADAMASESLRRWQDEQAGPPADADPRPVVAPTNVGRAKQWWRRLISKP